MAARKGKTINLVPTDELSESTSGIVLAWALSVGRILVILTELVVIGAFFSRFYLDARITDLNDEIKTKQAVIVSSQEFEKDYRKIQKKLEVFTGIISKASTASYLEVITSSLPPDVILKNISFTGSTLAIQGSAFSEASVASYIASLQQNENIAGVALTQISSGAEAGITFALEAVPARTVTKSNQ